MQSMAQAWLVYRLTGSSLLLGSVGFASQFPVFLVAPLGGIVADRHNRKRVVIGTQVASMILALVLALLTLTNKVQIWHIFVLAALLGVVNAFDIPGRQAFLVDMVGKEDLMNAIALNSSMFNGARIIGPAIAGILVAKLGEGWCFFGNGVSYIAVIIGLMMMRVERPARRVSAASPWAHIIEGFRFVFHTAPMRAILLLLGLVSLVAMPYTILMPIFADKILHGGARGLGILMGATGIGALLGALTLASRSGVYGLGKWIAFSCGGFGVSLILFSFSQEFLALRRTAASRRLRHDAANVVVEHPDSGHGPRSSARTCDGGLFHDVHGHGPIRSLPGRSTGGSSGRACNSFHGSSSVHRRRSPLRIATPQNPRRSPPANRRPRHDRRRPTRRNDRQSSRRLGRCKCGDGRVARRHIN